jgi:hypothetical protein
MKVKWASDSDGTCFYVQKDDFGRKQDDLTPIELTQYEHLFSAAPDLLAACKLAVKWDSDGEVSLPFPLLDTIEEAISKAEGEQNES